MSVATPMPRTSAGAIVSRTVAALLGNYAVTLGVASLLAVTLASAGVARPDAIALSSMLGFLFYLVLLLYAFHTVRLTRLWCWLVAAATISHALARWLGAML